MANKGCSVECSLLCASTANHSVKAQGSHSKVCSTLVPWNTMCFITHILQILSMSMTILNACTTGNLSTAEDLLTQEIDSDADNYNSYANRSFVMAQKLDWDSALHDALKVRWTHRTSVEIR
jgi:hypothetical protein